MTAPKTLPRDPFEAALSRHLRAQAEPVPPRLAAAVDEALRETLPERRTGWVGGDVLRSRPALLSVAGMAVALCLVAAGLAVVGIGRPPAPPEMAAPAAVAASPAPTATPMATPAPSDDPVAEPRHGSTGDVSRRNGRIPSPSSPPRAAIDVDGTGVDTADDRAGHEAQLDASPEPTPLVLDDGTVIDAELADAIDSLLSSVEDASPTATPDPRDRTVEIEAELRATLPDGLEPTGLVQDARGGTLFIDRTDGTVYRAALGGKVTSIVEPGDTARGGATIGAAVQLAAADDYVIIVDDEGRPFRWNSARGGVLAQVDLTDRAGFSPAHGDVEVYDPPVGAYRIYVLEPDREQIMKYTQVFDGSAFAAPVPWLASPSEEVANARQLYVDFDMYTLLEDGLRRYVAGKWDGSWTPASPPPGISAAVPDYRIVTGSGSDASRGRLYLYDAANARIVGISKVDGRFMRQWVLADGGPELDDVRGLHVIEGGLSGRRTRRKDDQLVWVTPDGIYRATLRIPPLTDS